MANMKNKISSIRENIELLELSYTVGKSVTRYNHLENSVAGSLKIKHMHTTPVYPREIKGYGHTKTYTWIFLTDVFVIAQNWKQCICPSTGQWINKLWYCHTIKRSELWIYTTMWIISSMLSGRNQI